MNSERERGSLRGGNEEDWKSARDVLYTSFAKCAQMRATLYLQLNNIHIKARPERTVCLTPNTQSSLLSLQSSFIASC